MNDMNDRNMSYSIRRGCLLCSLALLAGCAAAPVKEQAEVGPPSHRVFVANESSNSVTVIDAATYKVIGTLDSRNEWTHDLSLLRDGKRLFATNLASGRLSIIDTETLETIASVPTGKRSHVVTLTNDNQQAWVANIDEDNISIVDTTTFRILGTILVGKGPTGLAFSRDGRFAYVSTQGGETDPIAHHAPPRSGSPGGSVEIIETASHRVIKTIPVGANPHFLVLGPDGRIWGTNTGGNDIYVIDPATQEKVASLEVGPSPQQIAFAYKGMVGPNAYVTVSGLNTVVVVSGDSRTLRILEEIEVGERPDGIAANPEGTRLYVGNEGSNDLRVIEAGTSKVAATVPVGRKPIRVVVSR
jgi:YVTN family beta-propeller protein